MDSRLIFVVILTMAVREGHSYLESACYGGVRKPINCTTGERIKIKRAWYGSKHNCPPISTNSDCCAYDENDCLILYTDENLLSLYQSCSWKKRCTFDAPWIAIVNGKSEPCNKSEQTLTNYAFIEYSCVKEVYVYDGEETEGSNLQIVFSNNVTKSGRSCYLSSIGGHMQINAVDVRCNLSEGCLDINDISGNASKSVVGKVFLHGNQELFTTSSRNATLRISPGMTGDDLIWLHIKAIGSGNRQPKKNIRVSCSDGESNSSPASVASTTEMITQVGTTISDIPPPTQTPMVPISSTLLVSHSPETTIKRITQTTALPTPQMLIDSPGLGAIIGGAFGGILFLLAVASLVILILRFRRHKHENDYQERIYDKPSVHAQSETNTYAQLQVITPNGTTHATIPAEGDYTPADQPADTSYFILEPDNNESIRSNTETIIDQSAGDAGYFVIADDKSIANADNDLRNENPIERPHMRVDDLDAEYAIPDSNADAGYFIIEHDTPAITEPTPSSDNATRTQTHGEVSNEDGEYTYIDAGRHVSDYSMVDCMVDNDAYVGEPQ